MENKMNEAVKKTKRKSILPYRIDYTEEEIVITKKFAKEAGDMSRNAYKTMKKLREDFPTFKIVTKEIHKKENKRSYAHLTIERMEDIINRGGGDLCMKLWRADDKERMTDAPCSFQIDGITTTVRAGEVLRLRPGQSITFEPYMYHTFWAEGGHCMAGEVSTVNDDTADNRFYEPLGRYPQIEEDEPAEFTLCNEYTF